MGGESKLDMSLDDLIKKAKKPTGKVNKAKPGLQKQQGKGGGQQQQKGGVKGKAAPQQQQKKGVQLKAKGGVSKPGAGARQSAGKGSQQLQQRPGQRPKGQADVRVVPRPGRPSAVGGRGMGPRPGAPRPGMARPGMRPNMRPGMQTRQMGHPMMQAPYNVGPMGMGMGIGMGMQAPMMMPQMQQQMPPAAAAQPAPQQGKWQNDLFDGSVVSSSTSAKLFISNLDFKVTDEDITELFGTVGNIKESGIHYDKSGRSMGTAYVVFEKRADALAAFNRYNNVALDNKKMSIEVVETAVPRGTFKTLSSGINVSRQQPGGAAGVAGIRGRGMPHSVAVPAGDFMQE